MSIERQGHLGMGSHQSSQMLKDEWLTPPEVIAALGGPESFDLDPCAPIKRPWDMAKEHYTIADNGLLKPWHGRVWFNPPYGGPKIVGPWMRRMAEHGRGTTLIFARTETDLFFETVWKHATALLFLRGRLYFHHVDGTRAAANSGAPSVLIAYGERDAEILDQSSLAGHFIRLVTSTGMRTYRPHEGRGPSMNSQAEQERPYDVAFHENQIDKLDASERPSTVNSSGAPNP